MGLDLVLGGLVLVAAIRGWLRGFVTQAIKLGGLLGAIYLANPVRGLARPYVTEHLAAVRPDLLERLLWWASAAISYVVLVGAATLILKVQRRRTFGEPEPNRADQFAGLLLGGTKGALVAAFLLAGIESHARGWLQKVDWAQKQAATSKALAWNSKYHPAMQFWGSAPVQHLVAVVRENGLNSPVEPAGDAGMAKSPAVAPDATVEGEASPPSAETAQVAPTPHRLELPVPARLRDAEGDLRAELDVLRRQLDDPGHFNPR